MVAIRQWTGREASALQAALRLTVRAFAAELGLDPRTVTDWRRHGAAIVPRPDTQAILDTQLSRCTAEQLERFQLEIGESPSNRPSPRAAAAPLDLEQWSDDLDRAAVAIGGQRFTLASGLIERWRFRAAVHDRLDDRALHLTARAMVLHGDLLRDQGVLAGPGSALTAYRDGLSIYRELDIPRRAAQVSLSLAVVQEMSGDLEGSARAYRDLTRDPRLDGRDRARARLWVGTALSKLARHDAALRVMTDAAAAFERLGEPEEWAVAQQKLALANRGIGRLDRAQQLIGVAASAHTDHTPMQQVRLSTAHAHILVSDPATRESGLSLLGTCLTTAMRYGLSHQQRAIRDIRTAAENAR